MNNKWQLFLYNIKASFFAIIAALCSASVGIFSKGAFISGMHPIHVAFYKCVFAFVILSFSIVFNREIRYQVCSLKQHFKWISISSFFGVFTLYFCETLAYSTEQISTVTFILLSTSTITTIILSAVLLKEKLVIINAILCLLGLLLLFNNAVPISFGSGGILAALAGVGYGMFFIITKKVMSTLPKTAFIWWLIGMGTLFLFFPFLFSHPAIPSLENALNILPLSFFPTIVGFYCTTKALSLAKASRVQFLELLEPLFASLLAVVIFNEVLNQFTILGGLLIIIAISREQLLKSQLQKI